MSATDRPLPARVEVFDTTLRDGAQFEGISLTVEDKLRIAKQLDWLGVAYVEGGYPQANPKDEEFFRRARTELSFETATLVAFGLALAYAGLRVLLTTALEDARDLQAVTLN